MPSFVCRTSVQTETNSLSTYRRHVSSFGQAVGCVREDGEESKSICSEVEQGLGTVTVVFSAPWTS